MRFPERGLMMQRFQSIATLVAGALAATTLSAGAAEPTSSNVTHVAHAVEVPLEQNALAVEGHPLTSVVVTQCNLIVAVYMTMPDGRLLRFDKDAKVPSEQLMHMAFSAMRSERVEVSCNDAGADGFETHDPV
jgi:hypothetical protein